MFALLCREIVMDNLKVSFEDVADWCEKHLEDQRGREVGMTFGAMLRAYGRLATLSSRLHGEQRAAKEQELNAKAEELLMELSTRFLMAYGWFEKRIKLVESSPMRANMTYDTGPRPQE
jgi:hypothetical protein